jgi:Response regulator receiver domain
MAERIVLCIEPDSPTVDEIRRELEPYGFKIESIPNGEEAIEWGRSNPPALIVLSVEPRKVGYAICNKLKRSPTLREVPLVLISSEETPATFEQHKKLKSHADEYLLKPLEMSTMLEKIDGLVGLGGRSAGDGDGGPDEEEIEEIDADSDIVIAADDEDATISGAHASNGESGDTEIARDLLAGEDEGIPATPPPAARDITSEQHTVPGEGDDAPPPFEGEKFDPETQAAFAALEAGSPEGGPGGHEMVDLRNLWSDEDLPAALNWESPAGAGKGGPGGSAPERAAQGDATGRVASPDADPDSYRTGETLGPERVGSGAYASVDSGAEEVPLVLEALDDIPPALEEVHFDEATTDGAARPAGMGADLMSPPANDAQLREANARNTELAARIQSLENERQTLRKELEEARERFTQSATFSKEREFLGLREIINKKEKDILDLRDGMDAKERQILDHKDRIRELDRARRDLEEKTLGFERSLVAANEKVAELGQDKEKSVEREKGIKARLDDAHGELRKSNDEVDALKKRITHEEVRLRAEMDRLRGELERRLAESDDAHRGELSKLGDERSTAEAAAEAARDAERARTDAAHKAEVDGLQRRLADEQVAATDRLAAELGKQRKEHDGALAALRDEQAAQLASERQAYEALTEQKERDHRNEILGMRRRHEEERAAAEERRQRDIAEQEARRVAELEQAESRRRAELQARDEEQHTRITEIERRHLTETTAQAERHRSEHDQALGRAARAEGELAARAQELEQAYRRLAGVQGDLDATRAELGDREVRLAQARDNVAQLETKVTSYEDQVLRAYQRIRADEKTTEKTRRALAVALALIDERGTTPAPSAPMSTPPSGPTAIPPPPSAPSASAASKPVAEEV